MSPTLVRAHIVVTGEVQGVGYRHWTTQTAARLQIRGWVRNLDGYPLRVEIWAEAARSEDLDAFIEQCHVGPRYADVSKVEVSRVDGSSEPPARDFSIRSTARGPLQSI